MQSVRTLSLSMVGEALNEETIRYEVDSDGDIHFRIPRKKGKDLDLYVWKSAAERGVLALTCMVPRWFPSSNLNHLMIICNEWHKSHRIPNAWVMDPDSDGDYRVCLDYAVFCSSGVSMELLRETIIAFAGACISFWDELDEKL